MTADHFAALRRHPQWTPRSLRQAMLLVTATDVVGRSQVAPVVRLRHQVARLLWLQGMSVGEIAELLRRDHSTIGYAVAKGYRRVAPPGDPT